MLTGAQMRMARGYLRWSVRDLAAASEVSEATIKRMEAVDGVPQHVLTANLTKIRATLEGEGIVLPLDNGTAVSVRARELAPTE